MAPRKYDVQPASKYDVQPDAAPPEASKADRFMVWLKDAGEVLRTGEAKMTPEMRKQAEEAGPSWAKARSALMGFTSNTGDRIESLVDGLSQDPGAQAGWVYDNSDKIHAKYMKDVADNPGSNLVGAVLQPNPVAKAGLMARVGYAGANAAASRYNGDASASDGAIDDAFASGLGGAGVQALAEIAHPGLGRVAAKLDTTAGSAAASAAGLRGGIVNQAKRAGIPVLDRAGEDAIPAMGNRMLDAGLIPFGGSKMDVLRRAESMMSQTGNAADAIATRADMAGKFDQSLGVKAAAGRLAEKTDPTMGGNLQTARAADRAADFITDAANTPDTFKDAINLKRGAYGNTNWGTEAPDAAKLKRSAVSGYRQSIEDEVDNLLPGEGKALHDINASHGLAAQTADFAEEAAGREAAAKKLGPMQMLLAASGATAGSHFGTAGTVGGATLPLLAHVASTRGAAMAAPLARLGSRASAMAGKVVNQSPATSSSLGSRLADYMRVGSPEAQKAAAQHVGATTGEEPEDKDDVARKFFIEGI